MPLLDGDYFDKTVIYICRDSDEGTMGLVINRPVNYTLGEMFETQNLELPQKIRKQPLIEGGPVAEDIPLILHTSEVKTQSSWLLQDGLAVTIPANDVGDYKRIVRDVIAGKGPKQFLFALGHAGWTAGQLDDEVANNGWLTCPYDRKLLFETPFEKRYQVACENLGFDMNLMSRYAGDA